MQGKGATLPEMIRWIQGVGKVRGCEGARRAKVRRCEGSERHAPGAKSLSGHDTFARAFPYARTVALGRTLAPSHLALVIFSVP